MSDKETIADILREMRKGFNQSWWDVNHEWAHDLADRIEAAHRREMDEMEVLANSPTDFIFIDDPQTEVITEESKAAKRETGNAAKMREALATISRTELPPNIHTEVGAVFTFADGKCFARWAQMPYEEGGAK